MSIPTTRKCPICGRPYKVYDMYAGDQSACPECVAEAEKGVRRPSTPAEIGRRGRYYGTWENPQ